MFTLEGLSNLDYLRSGAFLVAYLAVMIGQKVNKKHYLLPADIISQIVVGGLLFFNPGELLGSISKVKPDMMALYCSKELGMALLFGLPVLYFFQLKNKKALYPALILVKTIVEVGTLCVMMQAKMANPKDFKPQFMSFTVFGCMIKCICFLYHLWTDVDFSEYKTSRPGNALNFHLLVDVLTMLPFVFFLIFPDVIPSIAADKGLKMNSLNTYAVQEMGMMLIGFLVFHVLALRVPDEEAKVAVMKNRCLMVLIGGIFSMYYQFTTPPFNEMFYKYLTPVGVVTIANCGLFMYNTGKDKTA